MADEKKELIMLVLWDIAVTLLAFIFMSSLADGEMILAGVTLILGVGGVLVQNMKFERVSLMLTRLQQFESGEMAKRLAELEAERLEQSK